ncbi:MAG: TM2 domain-containing protein [Methylobacter sp.]|nr:TM2 domain-containing protein [Methylobacter sp.]
MIGQIESYNPDSQTGTIKTEGAVFTFHLEDWVADVAPDEGDDVSFDAEGSIASNINLVGAYLEPPKAVKYKYLAAVLSVFLGWSGAARLYLGFYRLAFFQAILTVILYTSGAQQFIMLWGFIEGILLFGGHINKDAKGRPLK